MITAAGDHLTGSRTLGGHRKPRLLLLILVCELTKQNQRHMRSNSSERNHTCICRQRQNFFSFFLCSF